MTNLITEARELCESATPGPWNYDERVGCVAVYPGEEVKRMDESDGKRLYYANGCKVQDSMDWHWEIGEQECADAKFIARSRTLIPELCDALDKAAKKNDEIIRELSQLARESLERDKALAKLEAEVAAAVGEGCEYCLSTWPDRAADGFSDIWHGNKLSVGYGVYREIGYCPMCGRRLEEHHAAD